MKNDQNYSNEAWSQLLFYVHQQTMAPDHSTEYEDNLSSCHRGMCKGQMNRQTNRQINKLMDQAHSYITQFHYCRAGNNNTAQLRMDIDENEFECSTNRSISHFLDLGLPR